MRAVAGRGPPKEGVPAAPSSQAPALFKRALSASDATGGVALSPAVPLRERMSPWVAS